MYVSTAVRFGLTVFGLAFAFGDARAMQPQHGQWKMTTTTTFSGGPPGMPAGMAPQVRTQTQCITPEQAKDPRTAWKEPDGGPRGGQNCNTKRDWNGSVLTIDSTCGGNPPSTMKGTMTFDSATHYRGEMKATTPTGSTPMQVTITMEGQRVGECAK